MDIKYNIDDTVLLTGKVEAIQIRKETRMGSESFNQEPVVYYDILLDDNNRVRVSEQFIRGTTDCENIDLSLIPDIKIIDYLKSKRIIVGSDIWQTKRKKKGII